MTSSAVARKVCFISDLHLDSATEELTRAFVAFLKQKINTCQSLYILGDLFEVWVGDDDTSPLIETVAGALSELAESGTAILLMHGNRDFLMGESFANKCKAVLLEEPTFISIGSKKLALLHGDSLCTGDLEYMKYRKLVRGSEWQQEILAKSLQQRQVIAQQMRQQSLSHNSNKPSNIMDVTPREVVNFVQKHEIDILVHGHTHRPAVHKIQLDRPVHGSNEATRIVLGDWANKGWVLEFIGEDFELRSFAIQHMQGE